MFIRASRLRIPAEHIDGAIALFGDEVAPGFREAAGNLGSILLVDREKGRVLGLTYWETKEALDASERTGTENRTRVVSATGGTVEDVDRLELVVMERRAEPRAGRYVRVVDVAGDRGRIDDAIASLRDKAIPAVSGLHGFAALLGSVNRNTGRLVISGVWDTLADLQASESVVGDLRSGIAATVGARSVDVDIYHAAYVELRIPVTH